MPDEAGIQSTILPAQKSKGRVAALATGVGSQIAMLGVAVLNLTAEGIAGDRHCGFARAADSRVPWYRRGEPIRNERQVSLVSQEELAAIAFGLGVERIEPEWLGANVVVGGIPSFSFLPRGTLLFFQSGAVLVVTGQNAPCRVAGRSVASRSKAAEGLEFRFVDVSKRSRGVVAAVDRPGDIRSGDEIGVRVPEQWIWTT